VVDWTTIGEGAADVALTILAVAFPEATPVLAIVKQAIPALIAARPYIIQAVQEGKSAFQAAEAASPGLGAEIEALAKHIPMAAGVIDWATHLDHVTTLATPGFAVPGWSDQETQQWLDRASGPSGSQVGSA
jgi:hypothetical protein